MRPSKKNARGQGGTGQGIQEQLQQGETDSGTLATDGANESRIRDLQAAMDAAAASCDLTTYKALHEQWKGARAARSPDVVLRLESQHLAAVERAREMNDAGFWFVPQSARPARFNPDLAESFDLGEAEAAVRRAA